ncbi:MAG: hypothetical protein AAGM67_20275, partial [Bacteroidota bacterium]
VTVSKDENHIQIRENMKIISKFIKILLNSIKKRKSKNTGGKIEIFLQEECLIRYKVPLS